jgi:hypothetical protein
MNKVLRTILMVLGILLLAALLFGLGTQIYWAASGARWAGRVAVPMMGVWGMHRGVSMGWFPGFSGIVGLGILGLVVAGLVALFRGVGPRQPARVCAHCGKPLEAGWIACPHCGEKV